MVSTPEILLTSFLIGAVILAIFSGLVYFGFWLNERFGDGTVILILGFIGVSLVIGLYVLYLTGKIQ